jgi:pectinesterase
MKKIATLIIVIIVLLCIYTPSNGQFIKGTNIPADTTFNISREYHKYKKHYPFIIPVKDSVPKNVIAKRDIIYTTLENTPFGKRELHLDLFRPQKEGKYPTLIMIHGGGWRAGNKSLQAPMAEMIAAHGFVTITVEYQLSLEAKYPAAVHNIKSAIRWARANAAKYNIDADKIAISGCSAGGHLASLVGLTNGIEKFEGTMGNNKFSSKVQAIIDMDGLLSFLAPLSLKINQRPDAPDVFWLGGVFSEIPATWKDASPIYWANKNSVPMMFLNSGFLRFSSEQSELVRMLNEWGIYNKVHRFNVKLHPFWLFHPWVDETVIYTTNFLNKIFKE